MVLKQINMEPESTLYRHLHGVYVKFTKEVNRHSCLGAENKQHSSLISL